MAQLTQQTPSASDRTGDRADVRADVRADDRSHDEFAADYRDFVGEGLDSWHFPMMNDVVRNAAYEKALGGALRKGGVVLDIGTGSGLLSMLAVRQGATRVVTCEANQPIAEKAQEIIANNGFADRIQVINRRSTQLEVGKDLPERADVLVTEIFDDGLLGEYAFESIGHAIQHLIKPDAQIIPAGARVIAMAIESQEIFENHRVGQVSGFDLSPFNRLSVEGYSGYHLEKMEHRALSAPREIFDFDFRKIPGPGTLPVEFEAVSSGLCHAIVYWFELKMDSETKISTASGLPRRSCWKQAVQLLTVPVEFVKGESVPFVARHNSEEIWFRSP